MFQATFCLNYFVPIKNKTTILGKGNYDVMVRGHATKNKKKTNWFTIPAVFSTGARTEKQRSIHLITEQEQQPRRGLLSYGLLAAKSKPKQEATNAGLAKQITVYTCSQD